MTELKKKMLLMLYIVFIKSFYLLFFKKVYIAQLFSTCSVCPHSVFLSVECLFLDIVRPITHQDVQTNYRYHLLSVGYKIDTHQAGMDVHLPF